MLEHIDYMKWRVLVPDLLGFGDAPKPDVDYTPRDHAEVVLATLDAHGIYSATLVGHSMGSLVALAIAHRYPGRVTSLVLLGAPLYKTAAARWLVATTDAG